MPLLERFWKPFKARVAEKAETVDRAEATGARVLGSDPASGRQVSVRLGRYGPFAQIGQREEEEPPKFASLRSGQSIHTIDLEQALALFRLPRSLGSDPEGQEITVGIGRFGPFVKRGTTYASLRKEDDPHEIDLARGLELLKLKEEAIANRVIASFEDGAVQILRGRFGPFATDGSVLASLPKNAEPESFSLEQARALLAEKGKPVKKRGAARKAPAARKAAGKAGAGTATAKKAAKKAPGKAAKKVAKKAAGKTAKKAAGKSATKAVGKSAAAKATGKAAARTVAGTQATDAAVAPPKGRRASPADAG